MRALTPEMQSRRWLALGIVACAYMLSFFQRFAPAGIAQDLALAFQTSAASLGVLAATYFYVYTVMQIPTGILVDTLGSRRVLLLGGVVGGAGSVLFGMADSLDAALFGRTMIGLGVSVTFIAMLKIIAVWFDESRFATLVGASMLIGNLGSVLAGAPLSALSQNTGWRGVFVGIGAVSVVIGVACWLWVRDPTSPAPSTANPAPRRSSIWTQLWSVLRNRDTWSATLVNTGVAGSFFAFGGLWATPYLMQVHEMNRATASAHVSWYFAGFAMGCLLIGSLSDRLRRRKPVVIGASVMYVFVWGVWLSGVRMAEIHSMALFALMGACAASFTLTWACAKEVNPPHLSGMSTSVANMGGFLAGALLQPLVGWALDARWQGAVVDGLRFYSPETFRWGIAWMAGAALFGAISAWFLKETRCRNIWAG